MSRSKKKICGGGICCGSNHEWSKAEHRRERQMVKQIILSFMDETRIPHPKYWGDPWLSPSDGKSVYWWPWMLKTDAFKNNPEKIKCYMKSIGK